jgi:hypothetical protein
MNIKQLILAGCAVLALSVGTAQAGPCDTVGKFAKDAGAGPTPGNTGQTTTTGSAASQQPPTSTMNRATGGGATSSELDFGQFLTGLSTARDAEHRVAFDDLVGAVEHEFHAAEVSEGGPAAFDV